MSPVAVQWLDAASSSTGPMSILDPGNENVYTVLLRKLLERRLEDPELDGRITM
jgi:hypothetical protein